MAYRRRVRRYRKRSSRRRYGSGRRYMKRRSSRRMRSRRLRDPVMHIKRSVVIDHWVPGYAATNDFWRSLYTTLNFIPSASKYYGSFDKYKINGIKWTFVPKYNGHDGANTTDVTLPNISCVGMTHVSYQSDNRTLTTPTGVYSRANYNEFLQIGSARHFSGDRKFSIYSRPTIQGKDTADGVVRYVPAKWLNCADQYNVNHYCGQVFVWDNNFTGIENQAFELVATYYVTFKGIR